MGLATVFDDNANDVSITVSSLFRSRRLKKRWESWRSRVGGEGRGEQVVQTVMNFAWMSARDPHYSFFVSAPECRDIETAL